jgi:hypothetical protein
MQKIATVLMVGLTGMSTAFAQQTMQSSQVTFEIPLNLARLSPLISQVAVTCNVNAVPRAVTARIEVPVTAGQVARTVSLVMDLSSSDFKAGATVSYECTLAGFSTDLRLGGWLAFDPKNGAAFTVSPAPQPILGTFTW